MPADSPDEEIPAEQIVLEMLEIHLRRGLLISAQAVPGYVFFPGVHGYFVALRTGPSA